MGSRGCGITITGGIFLIWLQVMVTHMTIKITKQQG
jgi:hypothetical protein